RPLIAPTNSPIPSALLECSLVAFPVRCRVLFAILVLIAELTAIAMIGVVIAAARIWVERLAAPHVFAGDANAIAETELASGAHSITVSVTVPVAVVIAIIVAVVVTVVLGSCESCHAGQHSQGHCECHQLAFHKTLPAGLLRPFQLLAVRTHGEQ